MDCVRSPLLRLPGIKVLLMLSLDLLYPRSVLWCCTTRHSFEVGFCMWLCRPTVHVGHGKPDGVFTVAQWASLRGYKLGVIRTSTIWIRGQLMDVI